jgi:hypothetical protein
MQGSARKCKKTEEKRKRQVGFSRREPVIDGFCGAIFFFVFWVAF